MGKDTVQSLANQAATLADVLDVFARTLTETRERRRAACGPPPSAREAGAPGRSGARRPGAGHRLVSRLSRTPRVAGGRAGRRAASRPLVVARSPVARTAGDTPPSSVAERGRHGRPRMPRRLTILQWTADWLRELLPAAKAPPHPSSLRRRRTAQGGYWPPLVGHDSLNVAAEQAGRLTQVPDQNVSGTVSGVHPRGGTSPRTAGPFRNGRRRSFPLRHRARAPDRATATGDAAGRRGDGQAEPCSDVSAAREPAPAVARTPRERVSQHRAAGTGACRRSSTRTGDGDVILGFQLPAHAPLPDPDRERRGARARLVRTVAGADRLGAPS